jgi:hypothetical protein
MILMYMPICVVWTYVFKLTTSFIFPTHLHDTTKHINMCIFMLMLYILN